jgi:hypothetical protein
LLDPKAAAIAAAVLIPGLGMLATALAVERLLTIPAWSRRGLALVLGVGALFLNVVLLAVAAVAGLALALRRMPALGRAVLVVGRIAVPLGLGVIAVRSGIELWRDANAIL